jgi:hypothetical protein
MKKALTLVAIVTAVIGLGVGALIYAVGWDKIVGIFTEPKPDVEHPKRASSNGVSFEYPGNWELEEETDNIEGIVLRQMTVESPGSATAILQLMSPPFDVDLESYSASFLESMNEELKGGWKVLIEKGHATNQPITGTFLGQPAEGRKITMSLSVAGEKVPFNIEIWGKRGDSAAIVLITMVPDEDAAVAAPGLEQIKKSLASR